MTDFNTVFDHQKRIVGVFRFGVAWRKEPRQRLGEYDESHDGRLYDNAGSPVATFIGGTVFGLDGSIIGRFVQVEFSEFSGDTAAGTCGGLIKRIEVGGETAGWCIGNPGAACAAAYWLSHGKLLA